MTALRDNRLAIKQINASKLHYYFFSTEREYLSIRSGKKAVDIKALKDDI
jgi:hypothetical protein